MTEPALAISVPGKGRHYQHPVNEGLYPSVTNVIDVLAKPWLAGWKAKMVAGFAWDERHNVVRMRDRDAAIDYLKGGPTRARNKAAAIGDVIHSYAEAVAAGAPPPAIEAELEEHVEPFLVFLDEYHPHFRILEGTVFRGGPDDPLRYAGSFDCLFDLAGPDYGVSVLADYKSGGERVYDEVALQLAALSHADEVWDEATGELSPMPQVDGCVAIHLRPGKLAVHLIDAGEAALECFLGLRAAWPWDQSHVGAVGPKMNRVRLIKELQRPATLFEQLEESVKEASAAGNGPRKPESEGTSRATTSTTGLTRPNNGTDSPPAAEDSPADAGGPEIETEGDGNRTVAGTAPAGESSS